MQKLFVTGRVGRDSELRYTQNNKPVLNFSLATDSGWGENKKTIWHSCAVFGERATKLEPHIQKGKMLLVIGEATVRAYNNKDGEARGELNVFVHDLEFLGGQSDGGSSGGGQTQGGGGDGYSGGPALRDDLSGEVPF